MTGPAFSFPAAIDRYLFKREIGAFAAVVAVVCLLLTIENAPRIWSAVAQTSAPFALLGQMTAGLVPEYLAVAVLLASFLAPALAIRAMALRGEWQMLAATGLSPLRALAAPLLLAALACGLQLTLKLQLEPAGEALFEDLGTRVEAGQFGHPVPFQEFLPIDRRTTVLVEPPMRPDRMTGAIFLRAGGNSYSAASANLSRTSRNDIAVDLFDGVQVMGSTTAPTRAIRFAHYHVEIPNKAIAVPGTASAREQERQLTLGAWAERYGLPAASTAERERLLALLVARVSQALFCLLMPWLALALAPPPRRERGGAGIVLGVGLIVLFLRANAFVEARFAAWAIAAGAAHLGLWIAATVALVRKVQQGNEGSIDHAVNRLVERVRRRLRRPLARRSYAAMARLRFA